jgi:hypothetical protein
MLCGQSVRENSLPEFFVFAVFGLDGRHRLMDIAGLRPAAVPVGDANLLCLVAAVRRRRANTLELDPQDAIAWAMVQFRAGRRLGPNLWTRSLMSDKRDGDIMLYLESDKAAGCTREFTRMAQLSGFIGTFVPYVKTWRG